MFLTYSHVIITIVMKTKKEKYERFLNLFMSETPAKKVYHGDDLFLDKLVNPQNGETMKKLDFKKAGALLLAPAIIAGTISYSKNAPKENSNLTPSVTSSVQETINTPISFDNTTYLANYQGEPYYFITEEYALSLASDSLTRVKEMLSTVNGITPVATTTGEFYPEYFNEYLLTALCYTESSYRISKKNGEPLKSNAGAIGLTQVKPETLSSLNNWLHNTLHLNNITYTTEDLSDPSKAMDITTLLLIQICKNHGKMGCNNPIYPYIQESFSLKRQEEIILAIYNNGFNNMKSYVENGTIYNYLSEGPASNYVNKILTKKERLEEKYSDYYK